MGRWPRGTPAALAVVGLAAVGLSAACAPGTDLPGEVSARVYQTRSDVAARAIEIQVHNGTATEVIVTSAHLSSPYLRDTAQYDGATRIPPGATIDLKTPLPSASCDTDPGSASDAPAASATVELGFEIAGRAGQATLTAPDSLGQLPRIAAAACLQQRVERIVAVRGPGRLTDSGGALSLRYRLVPTGASGSVTFTATGPTTLLSPATATGRPVPAQSVEVTVMAASGARDIVVHYVPARCDAHAIAEDKQGTLLPMGVVTQSGSGSITLPVGADLRARIQRTVARICGLS